MVDWAAILVVAVVVLEAPVLELEDDDDWLDVWVVVYVLPAEFVVVNV